MRKLFIGAMLLGIAFTGFSNLQANSFDRIIAAISRGNISDLSNYFDNNIEITTKDSENSYSKTQADQVLQKFFEDHSPRSFNVVHQGNSPEGSKYFVANLTTSTGNFRTYIYAKQMGSSLLIQQIRFEEQ